MVAHALGYICGHAVDENVGAGGAGVASGDGECIVPACVRMMGMAALGGRGSIVLALPACLWNGGCAWVGDGALGTGLEGPLAG
ncbi:conserved hypothetical protein [Histoplasma capsulatum H143]|uniref:Uncharacterized protein n=1 Tax=Ajellomyces capsulatus (strain H143) TaxID=544712 RepID=C6HAB0_AJECH|nr:conserved hypothetical protein [Histoplasma capsulatum H143]